MKLIMKDVMKKVNCIMLVDDHPIESYFNTFLIKQANICDNFYNFHSGQEALDYLLMEVKQMEGSHKPDLLFIDINKPESRSYDFLTSFSELDEKLKSGIVVIILSGDPEEKAQAMLVKEVKEFITKPLELNTLYNLVDKYF